MTDVGNVALQTGGSLGTLVIIIFFARPFINKYFERSIDLMTKNVEALQNVSESMKSHDLRAELRAKAITKTFEVKIKKIDKRVETIGKDNEQYGTVLKKLYSHLAKEKGYPIEGGDTT